MREVEYQKFMVHPKRDFQVKNRYIEKGVEETLRYFDDTQFFLSKEYREQLRALKKQIEKNELILK